MASVYDVADRAGVSPATASRVLSGGDYPVKPATRERVLQAAAELKFHPNRLARALVTARTGTLGAIVHDIADPYFGEIVRGMEDTARLRGYQGFALQRVYTGDGELDETLVVRDRDVVLVPRGYHTVSAPPGYAVYYLNVMAGPVRAWAVANDPDHEWTMAS